MYFKQETITPEIARRLLDTQIVNRRLNPGRVNTYANDMKNGRWTESPEPICINQNGQLNNGQHRLQAVIVSGMPVVMSVAYDVPDEAVLDRGLPRSLGDSLYMRGLIDAELATKRVIALVTRYLEIKYGRRASEIADMDKVNFINENADHILTALRISEAGNRVATMTCHTAGARAAILGALINGVDEETLRSFATVANTGFMDDPTSSAAIIFRNFALTHTSYGASSANEIAAVAETSIQDFVAGNARKKKYNQPKHCYIQAA